MQAHLEPLSKTIWLIRVGESFNVFGDPYQAVCTFIRTGPDSGKIIGLAGVFNKRSFLAIKTQLNAVGIFKVKWERVKNNVIRRRQNEE